MTRPDTPSGSSNVAASSQAGTGPAASEGPDLTPRLRALAAEPIEEQERRGYRDTLREICQQPAAWLITAGDMGRLGPRLSAFLADAGVGARAGALVLTGSGSSCFVAAAVAPALQAALGVPVHVVPAGDLLTHPHAALPPSRPCVVVSFARSGNSPESAAVIDILLAREPACRHVVLTCCATGRLATEYAGASRVLVLVLDDRTCDRSLVMTSSFTSMVVAAHYLRFGGDLAAYLAWADRLSSVARLMLATQADAVAEAAAGPFRTVVFLGSGCRHGAAREAALKVTEMSDGRVLAFGETYLGVRHGPMTAIRDSTPGRSRAENRK
jgi:tagatose-6-phosphate ketose/aldose isomerase